MSKETFYFSHDYNARADRKLVSLAMKHGMTGIGIYWCLVEMLYEEGGYIPMEYDRISYELRTDKNVIQSIITEFELFENDSEKFWSNSVLERLQERADKSEKARESINKRWDKVKKDTNVIRSNSKRNTIKERKGKEIKESKEVKIDFEIFWNLYDKKVDRSKCEIKWNRLSLSDQTMCIEKIPIYILSTPDKKYRRDPETYLNNKSWENEVIKPQQMSNGLISKTHQ